MTERLLTQSHAASDAVLEEAIKLHPGAVPILLKKIGADLPVEALNESLRAPGSYSDSNGEDSYVYLLSHLYAARSESLWKEADKQSWLVTTFKRVWPSIKDNLPVAPPEASVDVLLGIYRHVIVSDIPDSLRQQLISYIPHRLSSKSELLDASDPFYPTEGTRFDDDYFSDVSGRLPRAGQQGRSMDDLQRMLARVEQEVPEGERVSLSDVLRASTQELNEGLFITGKLFRQSYDASWRWPRQCRGCRRGRRRRACRSRWGWGLCRWAVATRGSLLPALKPRRLERQSVAYLISAVFQPLDEDIWQD